MHGAPPIPEFIALILYLQVTYWFMSTTGAFKKYGVSDYSNNIFYLVATIFTALNYSCNFFIYILANSSFRKDLRLVLMRCKSRVMGGKDMKLSSRGPQSTGMSTLSSDPNHHQLREISSTPGNNSSPVIHNKYTSSAKHHSNNNDVPWIKWIIHNYRFIYILYIYHNNNIIYYIEN